MDRSGDEARPGDPQHLGDLPGDPVDQVVDRVVPGEHRLGGAEDAVEVAGTRCANQGSLDATQRTSPGTHSLEQVGT